MTKQQEDKIIGDIITALGTYALGDIENSRKMNIMLATFILCSCFIDQMAQIGYYKKNNKIGENFKEFVRGYFGSRYDDELLYDSLRSRLVHNYSVNGKYWLSDESTYMNLEVVNNRIHLNIDDFINDIRTVWMKFKNDLENDNVIRARAIRHDKKFPVLRHSRIASI
ncbi:hypothetical protein [Longitalea luteola]|uniref:hypothetical protein n=1 Tax=Longitalea luteola TaxID=2812563 RepID=UPI001A9607C5|nr:hypothetical protein [Longitalea luteola]